MYVCVCVSHCVSRVVRIKELLRVIYPTNYTYSHRDGEEVKVSPLLLCVVAHFLSPHLYLTLLSRHQRNRAACYCTLDQTQQHSRFAVKL